MNPSMIVTLQRDTEKPDGVTMGTLFVDGLFEAWTLEPDDDGPHPAIPFGSYPLTITHSTRFNRRLPQVLNVPGRFGIRFHPGNDVEDTEGCILLGTARSDDQVWHSRDACNAFQSKLAPAIARGEPILLIVLVKEKGKFA
jgi:Steigviridae/Suoliviridae L,D-carboxypeptidase/transpeptidase